MTIPDFQTVMLPLMEVTAKQGSLQIKDVIRLIAEHFNLTEEEKTQLLSSGKQTIIANRVNWACTYLSKADLINRPRRGVIEITELGHNLLQEQPRSIDIELLKRYPKFFEFFAKKEKQKNEDLILDDIKNDRNTPEESLEEAYSQIKNQLLTDVLDNLKSSSPQRFESIVVDTIVKMGYGGSRKDAGKAVGKSGDEGIDGIINEDRLGLDVIYLQAKRWDTNIGRPEIQKFVGALQGKRAKKGVFITTSDFTADAYQYVKNIESTIILISGQRLADLMCEYNIGMYTTVTYEIKKLDSEYFQE